MLIVGPMSFSLLRQHLGQEAVLDAYGRMSASAKVTEFTLATTDHGRRKRLALSRMTNVDLATGRQIVVRLAQFARFRDARSASSAPYRHVGGPRVHGPLALPDGCGRTGARRG